MPPPEPRTPAQTRWIHEQPGWTIAALRPLSVQQLIREARAAGYCGSQSKLSRLARAYVNARESESFVAWLHHDSTGDTAVWRAEGGGRHAR